MNFRSDCCRFLNDWLLLALVAACDLSRSQFCELRGSDSNFSVYLSFFWGRCLHFEASAQLEHLSCLEFHQQVSEIEYFRGTY